MECNLPDLTDAQNRRIREILEETNVIDSQAIFPEILHNRKK